jgi:hypothetical protein
VASFLRGRKYSTVLAPEFTAERFAAALGTMNYEAVLDLQCKNQKQSTCDVAFSSSIPPPLFLRRAIFELIRLFQLITQ